MIITDKILEAFRGFIGWEQDTDNADLQLPADMTSSESGLYFQQEHPLLTLTNLAACAPSEGKTFAEWLRTRTDYSVTRTLQRFVTDKLNNKTARGILDRIPLFDGVGSLSNITIPTGLTVGLMLAPKRSNGVTIKIERIGLQFEGTGSVDIHIMHSSCTEPIQTITLTRTKSGSMEWFDQKGLYLPYMGNRQDAGGIWYLCYDQGTHRSVNKNRNWNNTCKTCNSSEARNTMLVSQFVDVMPFRVDRAGSASMWDYEDVMTVTDNNYGINLVISAECDFTDFIVSQKHLFQDAVCKQVAYDMLRAIAFNPNARVNRNEATFSKGEILYELDGDSSSNKKSGLGYELQKTFDSIELDITGFDKICLPCARKGVRYKPIG